MKTICRPVSISNKT